MSGPLGVIAQYALLTSLSEGDVFEHGALLKFDSERLVWRCEETVPVETSEGLRRQVTLHVYWGGVMLRAFTAWLDDKTQGVRWVSRVN